MSAKRANLPLPTQETAVYSLPTPKRRRLTGGDKSSPYGHQQQWLQAPITRAIESQGARLRKEVAKLKAERDPKKGRSLLREGSDMRFA
ncbi:MAG: hypothetical protein EOS42_12085, partial [Mesorhizobium sp.]